MRQVVAIVQILVTTAILAEAAGCRDANSQQTGAKPRPVTALELRVESPIEPIKLTGAVTAWKAQDVAFEVAGRVEFIVERGTWLEGRWEKDGKVEVEGDKVGWLDRSFYQAALAQAEATLALSKIDLNSTLPAKLAHAQANLANQESEYRRITSIPEEAVIPIELTRAEANFKMAVAEVDQAQAALTAGSASIEQAEAAVDQARLDLDHSILYAPFTCEVADIYVERGGYARAGQPVAHLVMMDPIQIEVAVSQETAAPLSRDDFVRVFLPGSEAPIIGRVYEKSTVADPETRTFRIFIVTRNVRDVFQRPDDPAFPVEFIEDFMFLMRIDAGDENSPFMVEENLALRRDEKGYFVWAAPDVKMGDAIDPARPVLTLRKMRVTPGQWRRSYQELYLMRELADVGELEAGTLIAMNVPDSVVDGGQVYVRRQQWNLRPGQLVSLLLGETVPPTGFYVPMKVIRPIDASSGEIFVVDNGVARRVKVAIRENVAERFRIEPADPEAESPLKAGARVIADHIHFLEDGEPVQIVKVLEGAR